MFCGDGEMDEPESLSGLSLASREKLDNLIFVINANLQRLDGPVRGNGSIILELEKTFNAHDWHVIKVIWSQAWEHLWSLDTSGKIRQHMATWVDGDVQLFAQSDVTQRRAMLFPQDQGLEAINHALSDEQIAALDRGGHDITTHSAMQEAMSVHGKPKVILVHSLKGHGMPDVAAFNTAHNFKKMTSEQLVHLGRHLHIPLNDDEMMQATFYRPDAQEPMMQWLHEQRKKLGDGYVPSRRVEHDAVNMPALSIFDGQMKALDKPASTTMVFVRLLMILLRQPALKKLIRPIVADESRTFGMEGLFKQLGIYTPDGQQYTPVDQGHIMPYLEKEDGMLFQEGINEAGAMASWMAVGTAHTNHQVPLIPFYIYYSMFGFQRIGDMAWAAGDMLARGFLLGATAGRTTLEGEGLQHADGHSHVMAATIPNCQCYDPCFAYELAVIMHHGLVRMYEQNIDEFYYITLMNEKMSHPAMPEGVEDGIIQGAYCLDKPDQSQVVLLGSGAILQEVIKAKALLASISVHAEVWSVTSFVQLAREGKRVERLNALHPDKPAKRAYVSQCFPPLPILAATDYIRAHADQIRPYLNQPYQVLGTDGYGRRDTRQAMRAFFEVDAANIAYHALAHLVTLKHVALDVLLTAKQQWGIEPEQIDPLDR